MAAAAYISSQDDAFDAIQAAFPNASEELINDFMDVAEDCEVFPSIERFAKFIEV